MATDLFIRAWCTQHKTKAHKQTTNGMRTQHPLIAKHSESREISLYNKTHAPTQYKEYTEHVNTKPKRDATPCTQDHSRVHKSV